MDITAGDTAIAGGDTPDGRLVLAFLLQLGILRRSVRTYPGNHPVVADAVAKNLRSLAPIFNLCDRFVIGVSRTTVIYGAGPLEKNNPVLHDFARTLFGHGVATVFFMRGVTGDELRKFCEIINEQPLKWKEGVGRLIAAAGLRYVDVTEVDYGNFRLTQEERFTKTSPDEQVSGSLWDRFICGMLEGTLDPLGKAGDLRPEALAEFFNGMSERSPEVFRAGGYDRVIVSFVRQIEQLESAGARQNESLQMLGQFVEKLAPQVREKFLEAVLSSAAADARFLERVMSHLPDEVLDEVVDRFCTGKFFLPPAGAAFLEKLAAGRCNAIFSADERRLDAWLHSMVSEEELVDLNLSVDNRRFLDTLFASYRMSEQGMQEVEEMKGEIAGHKLENFLNSVLLELVVQDTTGNPPLLFTENIIDRLRYFLEIGEYAPLIWVCDRLLHIDPSQPLSDPLTHLVRFFQNRDFAAAVLGGVTLWGRPKYSDIQQIILLVGRPFIPELLDRLADEQNRSVRRFYLDRLQDLSSLAIPEVVERLQDPRWYYVRNLLHLIRVHNDRSLAREVCRLAGHPDQRVRIEVIKTLLHFQDPDAVRILLRDLSDSNPEVLMNAVAAARLSRSPEVTARLLKLLERPGISGSELELKIAVVQGLGEMAATEALPVLERWLGAKQILNMNAINRVKLEIVRSLDKYPAERAAPILRKVAGSAGSDIGKLAGEMLRQIEGGAQ